MAEEVVELQQELDEAEYNEGAGDTLKHLVKVLGLTGLQVEVISNSPDPEHAVKRALVEAGWTGP